MDADLFNELESNLKEAVGMATKLPNHITNPNPEVYNGENYLVLDFETTVHGKGLGLYEENRIVLACWSVGRDHPRASEYGDDTVRRWASEYELGDLVRDCNEAEFVVCHNAKFELQWLARCGLDLSTVVVYDTMLGEYVLGGNRWVFYNLSLEKCAQRWFGEGKHDIISKLYKSGHCSTEIPASWLEAYCVQDVALTRRLFLAQREKLDSRNQLPIIYTRCLLTPVLADIETNGMTLDPDLVRTRCAELEKEYALAEEEMDEITGGINVRSPKQLAVYLYETLELPERKVKQRGRWTELRTPSGNPATDADTIVLLKATTAAQRRFITHFKRLKELYNELTKYLRKFDECCVNDGGLLKAQFNQSSTQTHRLSSSGLEYKTQFQNFPRAYKPLFKAGRAGWLVGECDGAQLEFRVAGHLGRDSAAIDDIRGGTDVHSVTADIIGCSRQDAKAHTFKPLYGGTSGTDDERRYYAYFREKYDGITSRQQCWIDEVLRNKFLVTEWGMRYYWPDTRMDASGYVTNTTSICNYPVQAFATAEIIPVALVYFWHRVRARGLALRVVNTVHDSIICEIPPDEIEEFHELSRQCLIDDVYEYISNVYGVDITVPLGCGVKVASHWGGKDAPEYVPDGVEHDEGEVVYNQR